MSVRSVVKIWGLDNVSNVICMSEKKESDLSPNARNLWLKAQSAVELRNFGYAISLIQAVLKEEPAFLTGRKWLRDAELAKNSGSKSFLGKLGGGSSIQVMKAQGLLKKDPLAAMEAAEKVLETEPTNQAANILLKDAALAAGFPETAGFALETLKNANPTDTKVLHLFARFHLEHGDPEKAVETFTKIVEINPTDLEANKLGKDAAAKHSMRSGGWETAKDYRDIIANKDQAVQLEQKNRAHKDDATIDELLLELGGQYEQNPENVDVVKRMAGLYEQKADLEKALEWFQYADGLVNGSDPGIARKISDLSLKQLSRRVDEIERWLSTDPPEDEETQAFRVELEGLKQQKAERQLSEAKRRVEKNPTELALRLELGELLVGAGQYAEATPELQKARTSPNGRYKAIMLLGKCYMARKMYDLARDQLTEAANELTGMDPIKKEIVYTLGLLYEKMGDNAKSLECMKQIYSVDAGYMDVGSRVESSYQ